MRSNYGFYGANEFAFGMMWGAHGVRNLSVLRIEDVRIAVDKAYIDMTPRTIKGLGLKFLNEVSAKNKSKLFEKNKSKLIELKQKEINAVKDKLAENLIGVFKGNSTFDDPKHEELCKSFIKDFQDAINNINQEIKSCFSSTETIDPNQITYGKSQKIVNMSFKYLYLFEDAHLYPNIFDGCHMAIDENILKWFRKNDKDKKSIFNVTWSNMTKTQYNGIKNEIKSYCTNHSIASDFAKANKPFYAEFYIFDLAVNG